MSKFCEICRGTGEVECAARPSFGLWCSYEGCNGITTPCPECDGFDADAAGDAALERMKEVSK